VKELRQPSKKMMIRNLRGVAAIAASVRSTSPHRHALFPAPSLANAPTVLPAEGPTRVNGPLHQRGQFFFERADPLRMQTPLAANVSGGTQMQMSFPRERHQRRCGTLTAYFSTAGSLRLPTLQLRPSVEAICRMREHRRRRYHLHLGYGFGSNAGGSR